MRTAALLILFRTSAAFSTSSVRRQPVALRSSNAEDREPLSPDAQRVLANIEAQRAAGMSDADILDAADFGSMTGGGAVVALPKSGAAAWGRWRALKETTELDLCVDADTRARDVRVELTFGSLTVAVGDFPELILLEGKLSRPMTDVYWTLEDADDDDDDDRKLLCIELTHATHPDPDVQKHVEGTLGNDPIFDGPVEIRDNAIVDEGLASPERGTYA